MTVKYVICSLCLLKTNCCSVRFGGFIDCTTSKTNGNGLRGHGGEKQKQKRVARNLVRNSKEFQLSEFDRLIRIND